MKYEVEVKARVKNFDEIIPKLKELGCVLSEPIMQDDYIFNQKGIDLYKGHGDLSVLRIREQDKKIIFTLKKNRSNELDCIEKEIEVNDKNTLKEIIELLGFESNVEVHKKRIKTNYKDYEICLDEVDGLGTYIEVEKMSDEDGEKVQEELFGFLQTLGILKEDKVFNGYDTLIWLKNNQK
ncbi:MAG: class IV adenylate cyclase [Candidatus Paceibacterota bacterium]